MRDAPMLDEVKGRIEKGLKTQVLDKYKSEVKLEEYGHQHLYKRKNVDCKDVMYGVIQDVKQNTPFNKLKPQEYLDIENLMIALLAHEKGLGD